MKANEINIEQGGGELVIIPKGKRYIDLLYLGRLFPTTKPQAEKFVKNHMKFDVLNGREVGQIEFLFNEFAESGEYVYTKSKTWVRLRYDQYEKLYEILRKKYNF